MTIGKRKKRRKVSLLTWHVYIIADANDRSIDSVLRAGRLLGLSLLCVVAISFIVVVSTRLLGAFGVRRLHGLGLGSFQQRNKRLNRTLLVNR
jgi:hypothetical protein